ncbi:MAG: DNA translocase FtsK [Cypionkella sp.]|nr:DNA translocase FtsK [Cypionkella sp.]
MASYNARQRDPLLDQGTQAMLERRGRELIGIGLVLVALAFALMLASYSPNDPGWMVATDEPAANIMGRFGAALASTLIIIGGKGAWGIPVVLAAWGSRFVLHRGAERAIGRVVFAVIAIAMGSVYAATLTPGADWSHAFSLGGLFGDTVLGALLGLLPVSATYAIKLVSLLIGPAFLAMLLYVCGFDRSELRSSARFLITGLIVTYSTLLGAAGKGAQGTARAAAALQDRRRAASEAAKPTEHRSATHSEPAPGWGRPASLRADSRYPEPLAEAPHYAAPREKTGLLARMPSLMRRAVEPEPELIEPHSSYAADHAELPTDDRIKARISDAIRQRTHAPATETNPITAAIQRREPPVGRPRSPIPLIADTRGPRMEPPVVAGAIVTAPLNIPTLGAAARGFTAYEAKPDEQDTQIWGEAVQFQIEDDLPAAPLPRLIAETRRPAVVQTPVKKAVPSRQAESEAQPRLRFDDPAPAYELPPLSLLASPSTVQRHTLSHEALEENARMLESVLDDYGVKGEIVSVRPGPVVTMYELEPAPGLKASRVIGLADDIARSMSALSARVSTVPGRTVIGIELPNATREKVVLREIIAARDFGDSNMRLPLALGKDIGGEPIVANLAKMPHLLIAGTTGSGKSVAINTMILSLLYKLSPEECRLIMIDPKMLELSVYDGIPHLLSPVVTDPKKAVVALKWVVGEMEERYRRMSKMGVRNIEGYNGRVREALAKGELFNRTIQTGFDEDTGEPVFETEEFTLTPIPYIVVVVDEMADLMMVAGKEIEACIQRLAQMARASGIHLIMATQRPSVDVITGTIKANFPTRISFQVTSKIDSRTILGEQGAEQLLGMGDMLYMAGGGRVSRIHGPFVSDEEVEEIVNHLKSYGPPAYMSGVVEGPEDDAASDIDMVLGLGSGDATDDALYDQAVAIVAKDRKCSTSYIQRKLGIGYNKAARLVEQMEENHVVTTANHVGKREILLPEH